MGYTYIAGGYLELLNWLISFNIFYKNFFIYLFFIILDRISHKRWNAHTVDFGIFIIGVVEHKIFNQLILRIVKTRDVKKCRSKKKNLNERLNIKCIFFHKF